MQDASARGPGDAQIRHLDELVADFDHAMLVSRSIAGEFRARPMAIADHQPGAVLYFATRAEDDKLEEVIAEPRVAVTLQAGARFLSISGRARLDTDPVRIDERFSPSWRLWFPEGPKDPQLTLIRIEPTYAEYWDRSGTHRLEFLWEAGKALVAGEMADAEALGEHAKIPLRRRR